MNMKNIEVAGRIDSYCTKCRLWLEHTIVAILGSEIKKVECRTCGGIHKYRRSLPGIKSNTTTVRGSAKTPSSHAIQKKVDDHWENILDKITSAAPRFYQMRESYKVGDVINHTKFGLGMVTSIKGAYKIRVLFENGPKVLVCNRNGNKGV